MSRHRLSPGLCPAALLAITLCAANSSSQILYVSDIQGNVGEFDIGTAATRFVGSLPMQGYSINQLIGIAYDPIRDRILMCARHDNDVYSMNPATGVASVLFNPTQTFQGCAVLNDTLYGIDENTQRVAAYSLSTFAPVPMSGAALPGHIHSMGVDVALGELYISTSSTPGTWTVNSMGTPGPIVVALGGTEDIEGYGGNFIAAPYNRTITVINTAMVSTVVLIDTAGLTAMGVTGSTTGVALRQTLGPAILLVDTALTQVYPTQMGMAVSIDVENTGGDILDITSASPAFIDAAMVDVSSEYTVTPAPGNPTSIAVGAIASLDFTADLGVPATLGAITIDAAIQVTERISGATQMDTGSDVTDTWDVIGAVPMVRAVATPLSAVAQGSTGNAVSVTIENTGLLPMSVGAITLTFTGSADRTSEYTVNPSPANPISIAVGATENFAFSVDLSIAATTELITIDAGVTGQTTATGAAVADANADVTDTWNVFPCTAPTCGDCSGDLIVSIIDALIAAQHSAVLITLTGIDFSNCNVFGTLEPGPAAQVDILDALTLAQFAAGLPAMLICC